MHLSDKGDIPDVPEALPVEMNMAQWMSLVKSSRMEDWFTAQNDAKQKQVGLLFIYHDGFTHNAFSAIVALPGSTSALAQQTRLTAGVSIVSSVRKPAR